MGRFYFKIQDQDDVIQPDRGFEFPGVEEAKNEAKFLLAEMAVDGLPKGVIESLSVELQDENRIPLLTVRLVLEVIPHDARQRRPSYQVAPNFNLSGPEQDKRIAVLSLPYTRLALAHTSERPCPRDARSLISNLADANFIL